MTNIEGLPDCVYCGEQQCGCWRRCDTCRHFAHRHPLMCVRKKCECGGWAAIFDDVELAAYTEKTR